MNANKMKKLLLLCFLLGIQSSLLCQKMTEKSFSKPSRNLFRDTVSVEEMMQAFYTAMDTSYHRYAQVLDQLYTDAVFLNMPRKKCPWLKSESARCYWSRRKFGNKELLMLDSVQGQWASSVGIPGKWVSGNVTQLNQPWHYMTFMVSPELTFLSVRKGEIRDSGFYEIKGRYREIAPRPVDRCYTHWGEEVRFEYIFYNMT